MLPNIFKQWSMARKKTFAVKIHNKALCNIDISSSQMKKLVQGGLLICPTL